MRELDEAAFDRAFAELVSASCWQEEPAYYPRYRARYATLLRRYADYAPDVPIDVLDVGGGQLAFLTHALWRDRACVADIDASRFEELRARGLDTFQWDLARGEPAIDRLFDAIFLSEVIEHLPVPGHIVLRRLRQLLRPGGLLLCSTPNLYRLRNVAALILGRPIFDHFDLPGEESYGHVLEYSAEHLRWQFERAGFVRHDVELQNFSHVPMARLDRMLATVGAPLRRVPRYRDSLLVLAEAP